MDDAAEQTELSVCQSCRSSYNPEFEGNHKLCGRCEFVYADSFVDEPLPENNMDNVEVAFAVNSQKLEVFRGALSTLLSNSICRVYFTKVDGTESDMKCTLRSDLLPPFAEKKEGSVEKKPNLETLPVFKLDGEKSGWRSFRLDSLKKVEVLYE